MTTDPRQEEEEEDKLTSYLEVDGSAGSKADCVELEEAIMASDNEEGRLIPVTRQNSIPVAYDELLAKIGFTFRLFVIVTCSGLGLLSDTLEIMSISFAKDDIAQKLKLTRQEESTLAGVLFAGMLIGGLFWGRAADIYGRRRVLMVSLSMNGLCAAASAFAISFPSFLIARFLSGIGVGGSLPIIFSYTSEWSPLKIRGRVISIVATCWMIGSVLAAAAAWAILPVEFSNSSQAFWQPWRLYLLVCSVPSIVAAFLYSILYESPIFLIQTGKRKQALEILRIYATGVPGVAGELGALKRLLEDEEFIKPPARSFSITRIIVEFIQGLVKLFEGPLSRVTLLIMSVMLPVHFGYYGFMLWLPEYLKKQHPTETLQSITEVYVQSFYVSLASLPGNLFTIILSDRIGPKPILCGSLLLSACSVFLLWEFNSPNMITLLSCLFNAVSVPVFNMLDIILPALYPTSSRSTAFGFHSSLVRVTMILSTWMFSLFIDSSPAAPILITAILLATSAGTSFLLPAVSVVH